VACAVPRTEPLNRVIVIALISAAAGLVPAHRAYRTAEIVLSGGACWSRWQWAVSRWSWSTSSGC
jgi:hypothetical protein